MDVRESSCTVKPYTIWPFSGLPSYLSVSFTLNGFSFFFFQLETQSLFCLRISVTSPTISPTRSLGMTLDREERVSRCSTNLCREHIRVMVGWVLCCSKHTIPGSSLTYILRKQVFREHLQLVGCLHAEMTMLRGPPGEQNPTPTTPAFLKEGVPRKDAANSSPITRPHGKNQVLFHRSEAKARCSN